MNIRVSASLRLVPLALVLAACADRSPVSPDVQSPAPAAARLTCTATVRSATVVCRTDAPAGVRADLIAGEGYVKLASSGTSYDGTSTLRTEVTVQNLMPQAIGTTDGVSPAPQGVRVFFASGPTVTAGTGTVSVQNPDGTAVFTAAEQPFFRYDQVLAPNQTSAPREWRFTLPSTVETFVFTLYVSAPAANEAGQVDVAPAHPSLPVGATRMLTGTVRTGSGRATGDPVAWSSSDPTVATVDASGQVTAVAPGNAFIFATGGGRGGFTQVSVYQGSSDVTPATLEALSFTPGAVDVQASPDTLDVTFTVSDDLSGVGRVFVFFRTPSGASGSVTESCTRTSGTATLGTYACKVQVRRFVEPGSWIINEVQVEDVLGNTRLYTTAELRAAGFPVSLQVASTHDAAAPVLTAFSMTPDSVDVRTGPDTVDAMVTITDDASGLGRMFVFVTSPSGASGGVGNSCELVTGSETGGTFHCSILVRQWVEPGAWRVSEVLLEDKVGNRRSLTTAQLQAAGFPTALKVASVHDAAAPVLTGFSLDPDSIDVRTAPDTTFATVSVTDDASGIGRMFVFLRSPGGASGAVSSGCVLASGTETAGTYTCPIVVQQFTEPGTWTVSEVLIDDQVGNSRTLTTSQLQAAGYEVTVKVTS